MEKLQKIINVNHMNQIASKYWKKGTHVSSIYVSFYKKEIDVNDLNENLIFKIFTNYYKTYKIEDNPENIDSYKTWFIEIDGKEYKLKEYSNLDFWKFLN